jgi:hypothetical protein
MGFKHLRIIAFAACGIAAGTLLGGCSADPSNLTRDRAATLIKPGLDGVTPLLRVTTGIMPAWTLTNEDRALIAVGFASRTVKPAKYGSQDANIVLTARGRELAASQKWHQEKLVYGLTAWQIPVGTYQFESVTGIQMADKSHALVTFAYTTKPNDVGKLFIGTGHANAIHVISPLADIGRMYPASVAQQAQNNAAALVQAMGMNPNPTMDVVFGKTSSATIPFTLYDDGWRPGQ